MRGQVVCCPWQPRAKVLGARLAWHSYSGSHEDKIRAALNFRHCSSDLGWLREECLATLRHVVNTTERGRSLYHMAAENLDVLMTNSKMYHGGYKTKMKGSAQRTQKKSACSSFHANEYQGCQPFGCCTKCIKMLWYILSITINYYHALLPIRMDSLSSSVCNPLVLIVMAGYRVLRLGYAWEGSARGCGGLPEAWRWNFNGGCAISLEGSFNPSPFGISLGYGRMTEWIFDSSPEMDFWKCNISLITRGIHLHIQRHFTRMGTFRELILFFQTSHVGKCFFGMKENGYSVLRHMTTIFVKYIYN